MLISLAALCLAAKPAIVTFESLLSEMADLSHLAEYPSANWRCLQASSYNRESVHRDKPGWFADGDGEGFIRTEEINGHTEWVMMEHVGPGAITKMWTPFFYRDFNERVGPNICIYLDGSKTPIVDESFIKLVTGKGSVGAPWAEYTARAGNCYLPIPFAKSAKVTMVQRPFYFIINYRAYPAGTQVKSLPKDWASAKKGAWNKASKALAKPFSVPTMKRYSIKKGGSETVYSDTGQGAINDLSLNIEGALKHPERLRSTVLSISFDGEETVWCPIGDFFSSADAIHPYETWARKVSKSGTMQCRWPMPYRKSVEVKILNRGESEIAVNCQANVVKRRWTPNSMHFYARWRPDEIVPGTPFQDWNFVDIAGKGVYVGDCWTVLNIRPNSWWGEGDEKIYVDGAWETGFPTHFGTGTEDYYGWAGGVYPVPEDNFSKLFLTNHIGGLDGHTQGYNICSRIRSLDAIPFSSRLRFDIEASLGTDMREPWDLLGYTAATFWYALPGAKHNLPPLPIAAEKRITSLKQLEEEAAKIRSISMLN